MKKLLSITIAVIMMVSINVTAFGTDKPKKAVPAKKKIGSHNKKSLSTKKGKKTLTNASSNRNNIHKGLILAVKSIDDLEIKEIVQDDNFTMPDTVTAQMNDGSEKQTKVSWNKTLDASHLGLNKFVGTVNGYSKPVSLYVLVRGKELGKPSETFETAKIGDIVGTTGTITADGFGNISYQHFGIYVGDDKVIEFSSKDGTIPSAKITLNPMSKSFSKYFIYKIDPQYVKYTPEEVVKRAYDSIGNGNYDLIGNNCEHFAVWCQTGVYKSYQSDSFPKELVVKADAYIKSVKGLN